MDHGRADQESGSHCAPIHDLLGAGTSRRRRATASREWAGFVARAWLLSSAAYASPARLAAGMHPGVAAHTHWRRPAPCSPRPQTRAARGARRSTAAAGRTSRAASSAPRPGSASPRRRRRSGGQRCGAAPALQIDRASNQATQATIPLTPAPPLRCPARQLTAELERRGFVPKVHAVSFVKSAWYRVQDGRPIMVFEGADDGYAPEVLAKAADLVCAGHSGVQEVAGRCRLPRRGALVAPAWPSLAPFFRQPSAACRTLLARRVRAAQPMQPVGMPRPPPPPTHSLPGGAVLLHGVLHPLHGRGDAPAGLGRVQQAQGPRGRLRGAWWCPRLAHVAYDRSCAGCPCA
jgi:hypothetical protein